jgi:ABC-type nitrate/sulfonate/bicarbonate transport system substrate-binding protein
MFWFHALQRLTTSPFKKGGSRGIWKLRRSNKSPLPPFVEGGISPLTYLIASITPWVRTLIIVAATFSISAADVSALETVNMALSNKNFQMILYPIAQERGYMQEEGIDLRVILARAELSVQATMAGSFQFNMAGTMAVVNVMKGGAPFKVILATNDKVLSWILSKPEITSLKDLKGKRIANSGVANVTLIMAKQVLQKHSIDPDRNINFINTGGGSNGVRALMAGAVDGVIASTAERYIGVPAGLRELSFIGNEVKNSWGTMATTDQLIQEKPKLVAGMVKASLKALRFIRNQRDATIAVAVKFAGLDKNIATRMYDDLVGTFNQNGMVDEETQRNDIEVIRQILKSPDTIPSQRAYDFRFAREADRQLTQSGWKP